MAKDSIGSLALLLSADSSGLAKDLAKAEAHVKGFAAKSSSNLSKLTTEAGSAFGKMFAPLAAAAGGIATASTFQSTINDIVQMEKEARKLGLTVKDMSLLLTMEGPDFETESMLTGIRKLGDSLYDAVVDPAGEAAKALKMFRLDAKQMIDAGTLESLKIFADKMHELESPEEQRKLAKLMGKAGHENIPFLSGGRSVFDDMKEAEGKGQAVTPSMAADAKAAAKAMDDLGDAVKAATQKIMTGLGPTVSLGAKAIEGSVGLGEKALQYLTEKVGNAWYYVLDSQLGVYTRLVAEQKAWEESEAKRLDDLEKGKRLKAAEVAAADAYNEKVKKSLTDLETGLAVLGKTEAEIVRIKLAAEGFKGPDLDKAFNIAKLTEIGKFAIDLQKQLDEIGLSQAELIVRRAEKIGQAGAELAKTKADVAEMERRNKLVDIRSRVAGDLAARIGERPLASDALVKGSQEDITFGANLAQPRFTLEDAVKAIPDAIKEGIDELNFRTALEAAVKEAAKEFAENIQVGVFN